MTSLVESPAWRALRSHLTQVPSDIAGLFRDDAQRAVDFSAEAAGLYLDYSKQRVTRETLRLLQALATQQDLSGWIARLFAGEAVNNTEQRAALHMALRAPKGQAMSAQGQDVSGAVHVELERLCAFAERVRSGVWRGYSGRPLSDVVNIGIGGSDLGPRMVCAALAGQAEGPRMHFVSNVDGAQIARLLHTLDAASTLWIVTSKTFTTQETMANAQTARQWFLRHADESAIARHFVAVSTNQAEVARFGIAEENVFGFWDWVGGRYSLWSAVGLAIVLAIGVEPFRRLLAGAHEMDTHFRTAPPERNLPVLMGLLGVWNNNFVGCASHNIAPYSQRLASLPAWLQQLEMESNGKRVDRQGRAVDYATTPALWGDVGTNGQHAYFQMLHQGSALHSIDFLLHTEAGHELTDQHRKLLANGLAQSAAMMSGKSADVVRAQLSARGLQGAALEAAIPHRVFPGGRPSNTLLLPRLDAFHLGALLALYEHRCFVQSVIWDINAFDQWGVQLGKQLAQDVLRAMDGAAVPLDPSTLKLLQKLRQS